MLLLLHIILTICNKVFIKTCFYISIIERFNPNKKKEIEFFPHDQHIACYINQCEFNPTCIYLKNCCFRLCSTLPDNFEGKVAECLMSNVWSDKGTYTSHRSQFFGNGWLVERFRFLLCLRFSRFRDFYIILESYISKCEHVSTIQLVSVGEKKQ